MAAQGTWQGNKIEISVHLSPKYLFLATENLVKVNGKKVAELGGFSLKNHVVTTFDHQEKTTQIEIQTKAGLFLPNYLIKINDQVVMEGYLGFETTGIMRVYFTLFGLGYMTSLTYLAFPIFRNIIFQMYDPLWFMAGAIIDAIFGILFLYFAISIKKLLFNSLRLLTTVLYIRIGFIVAITPSLILNLVQGINTGGLGWQLIIGLRLLYIWFFGYLLVNCKRLSQELRRNEE